MTRSAIIILFGPGFDDSELQMHKSLCLEYSKDLNVFPFILNGLSDLDSVFEFCKKFDQYVIWNNYWEVDAISVQIAERFRDRIVGSTHEINSRTYRKSIMYETFQEYGIPILWNALVENIEELENLENIPFPVIVKVDQGYDTLGMSGSSICRNETELSEEGKKILSMHGPVMIQKFVAGREFTIAYANLKAFAPIEKIYLNGQVLYISGEKYIKKNVDDPTLSSSLRKLSQKVAKAFHLKKTEYCRIDIREDSDSGELYPIDINNMCSVHPDSQFEHSLLGDGFARKDLIGWLTLPIQFEIMKKNIVLYIPFHSDLSQVENLIPFFRNFKCKVFIYKWNDAFDYMMKYFPEKMGAPAFALSTEAILEELDKETGNVVIMRTGTASPLYVYGKWQRKYFDAFQEFYPQIIDILSIGHCMEHSTCDACDSDIGHIPIKMTAYQTKILPFTPEEIRKVYNISSKTILVSMTTGADEILITDMEILNLFKNLQENEGFEFLFKLHPSTVMLAFNDTEFQEEKRGYEFVQKNFRIIEKEHFSIFPFTELININITDLFSSLPAMLTYFGEKIILAKDNPSVDKNHPLRKYLHTFYTAEELNRMLHNLEGLDSKNNGRFWRDYYPEVTGDEDRDVAADRKWFQSLKDVVPASHKKEVHGRIQELIEESKSLLKKKEITQDDYEEIVYYLEKI